VTTKNSSVRRLKAQSDKIAVTLKAAERGEATASDPTGKIARSIAAGVVKFGIVMDDKVITIEMPWATIREMDEAEISEWILAQMREESMQ
jgi:hypothetical protein